MVCSVLGKLASIKLMTCLFTSIPCLARARVFTSFEIMVTEDTSIIVLSLDNYIDGCIGQYEKKDCIFGMPLKKCCQILFGIIVQVPVFKIT